MQNLSLPLLITTRSRPVLFLFIVVFPVPWFLASGKLYQSMSFDMKVFDVFINSDAVDRLEKDESTIILFNLLRRLAFVFGGRAVHDAISHYLVLKGYDVHKL